MIDDIEQLAQMLDLFVKDLLSRNAADLLGDGSPNRKGQRTLDLSDAVAYVDPDWPGAVYIDLFGNRIGVNSVNGYWRVGVPVARATEAGLVRMKRVVEEWVAAVCEARRTGKPLAWTEFDYKVRVSG